MATFAFRDMRAIPFLPFLVLVSGCAGLPSLEKVQGSFRQEHPETVVLGVEGQLTNRYDAQFQIFYLKPGDTREHVDVWHYRHTAEAWIAGERESVR
jgi:hypothetical protein